MAQSKQFFLSVTQRIFSNWMGLKMAVEHGMGTKESALDFCEYMTEVIYMNERLSSSEIALELDDYMDNQFNTELQDNSSSEIADELLRFYQYCIQGNESTATIELEKLPPLQTWLVSKEPIKRTEVSCAAEDDESSSENEEADNSMDVVRDEWTEVRSRRKR